MIGKIIQSYLVSLGVQIDKPGFQQADATIKQTGENIDRVTAGMARNFVKASTIIFSAIASVTASAVGLMRAIAREDLAMRKYARSMMMSERAAWNMKKATDALGESINDIAMTPELFARYKQLTVDGAKMMPGGDFKQTMKDFRDLMFEFTRLKQEASYALNWVGYYLMKYLQKPLADIREKFKTFNDMVVKNMSVWTKKVARAIYYVVEVGRHFLEFIVDIGKHVKALWDSFPAGVKKAVVAITALQVALSAGPLGRAIMLISSLLLLIDDYYNHLEGKDALLGKYWDKLNNFLKGFIELIAELGKTEEFRELQAAVADLFDVVVELFDAIIDLVHVAFEGLFGQLDKKDIIRSFRDVLRTVLKVFTGIISAVNWVIGLLKDLFKLLAGNTTFKKIWQEVGKEIGNAIGKIGTFGGKLKDLWNWITGKTASVSGRGGSESGQGDTDWNKRVAYEKFKAAGYSDEAIAGIMGRVQQEHNFNTSNVPEYDDPETGLHLGGYGMFQWNGGRTTAYLEWARSNGLNPQDPGAQADYAIIEAQDRGITPERMNSKSVSEAATIWTDEWEVGEHGYEQSYAAEIYNDIINGAPWMQAKYDGVPFGGINEVRENIKQLREKLPLSETISDITAAGKNAGFYDAMRNDMPSYGRGGVGGGSMTVNVEVGGVNINGQGKTNEDVGRVVGEQILSSVAPVFGQTAQYLMQNCMANINAVPTPT